MPSNAGMIGAGDFRLPAPTIFPTMICPFSKFSALSVRTLVLASLVATVAIRVPAQTIALGSAASYAVIANTTITNTGTTFLVGDLGVSPGTVLTGSPTVSGATHIADSAASTALTDANIAYNQLAALSPTQTMSDPNLGGLTLTPGVYFFATTAQLTGTLTLNGLNQTAPLFVFQIGSTLTTAASSSIMLSSLANAGNVWWQVGTSATIGGSTGFNGSILATTAVTLNSGANSNGRAFALGGALSLDTNQISSPTAVPEPATTAALFAAAALVCVIIHRKRTVSAQSESTP